MAKKTTKAPAKGKKRKQSKANAGNFKLPETLAESIRKMDPKRGDDPTGGAIVTYQFLNRHEELFEQITAAIDGYAMANNGDALILMDASLLALAQRVRDYMGGKNVTIK